MLKEELETIIAKVESADRAGNLYGKTLGIGLLFTLKGDLLKKLQKIIRFDETAEMPNIVFLNILAIESLKKYIIQIFPQNWQNIFSSCWCFLKS